MSREDAERRLRTFERGHGRELVELAGHAALPVVLNPDFVHLLRVNYFLDPPVTLPYEAEAELLLSQLCTEVDDGFYVIDPDLRDVLLQRLVQQHRGPSRLQDVARLLWEYSQRSTPWPDRPGLTEAQQLSALNFIDPQRAHNWLARAEEMPGGGPAADERWFVAMRQDLADRSAAVQRAEEETAVEAQPQPVEVLVENGRMAAPPAEWQVLEEHRDRIEAAARSLCLIHEGISHGDPWLPSGRGFLAGRRVVLTPASVAHQLGPSPQADQVFVEFFDLPSVDKSLSQTPGISVIESVFAPVSRIEVLAGTDVAALLLPEGYGDMHPDLPTPLATAAAQPPDLVGRLVYALANVAGPASAPTGEPNVIPASSVTWVRPGRIVSMIAAQPAVEAAIVHDCIAGPLSPGSPLVDLVTGQALGLNTDTTVTFDEQGRVTATATALWPRIREWVRSLDAEALSISAQSDDAIATDSYALSPHAADEAAWPGPADEQPEHDLSLSDDDINALLVELSLIFSTEDRARTFLRSVRFPSPLIPAWTDAYDFWSRIFEDLARGAMEMPYRRLLNAALRVHGNSSVLANLQNRRPANAQAELDLLLSDDSINALLSELSLIFPNEDRARTFLRSVRFPRPLIPAWTDAYDFWSRVFEDLARGAMEMPYRRLLNAALRVHGNSRVLANLWDGYSPTPETCHLVVRVTLPEERDDITAWLTDQGFDPQPEWSSRSAIAFRLNQTDPGAVAAAMRAWPDIGWTVMPPGQADYLLPQMLAEGPDGRSFIFNDVPASSTVGSVAAEIIEHYPEGMPGGDAPTVVDRVGPDNAGRRANPDDTREQESPSRADINRLMYEMSRAFDTEERAAALLQAVGFPTRLLPVWQHDAYRFWAMVFEELDRGVMSAPYQRLISAALRLLPANVVLDDLGRRYPEASAEPSGQQDLFVTGPDGREFRITDVPTNTKMMVVPADRARVAHADRVVTELPYHDAATGDEDATERPTPVPADTKSHLIVYSESGEERTDIAGWLRDQRLDPEEVWSTASAVSFRLNRADPDAVTATMRARSDLRWVVVPPGQPDYLLRQISVEGPDGRSFRLNDVPSALPTSAVAETVVDQYPAELTGGGSPRVVDVVAPGDASRRTSPDNTLHDEGITEGSRLRVGMQRRAA